MDRKCSICKITKPLNKDVFVSSKNRPLGFSYECKECCRERAKVKHRQNPRKDRFSKMTREQKNKKQEWANEYKRNNLIGRTIAKWASYKEADRKRGRVFDLTKDFLAKEIQKECIYCGEKAFNKIGLDRVNNSIGHIMSNVVPCCDECNIARSNHFTHEEMFIIGDAIRMVKQQRANVIHLQLS